MKKLRFVFLGLGLLSLTANAQVGKTVSNVKLLTVNDAPKTISCLGNKAFTLFYVDPDVRTVTEPLSDAIKAKKYSKDKYAAVGVVNCKDTWLPNAAIISESKKKQTKFPESLILLDKDNSLSKAWALGKCDDLAQVLVIGKDGKIKYCKAIKTEEECKAIVPTVLKVLDAETK